MAFIDDIASKLSGRTRAETNSVMTDATTRTYIGTATSDSSDGSVYVALSEDVTMPDDYDGEHGVGVEMPTTVGVSEGDDVVVTVFGGGTMKAPVVTGNPGWGDDVDTRVTEAHDLAASVESIAQEAKEVAEATGQHFWTDNDGVHVTEVTQDEWSDSTSPSYHSGANVLLNALGQLFRNRLNNLLALLPAHYRTDEFTGDGTTTAFTLSVTPYEVTSVTVAGVTLTDEDWSASGDVVTLTTAPADGAVVSVAYRTSATSIAIFDGRGNQSSNAVAEFSEDGVTVGRTSSLNSFFNSVGIYFRNGVNNLLSLVAGKHYYHESNVTYGSTLYVSLGYYPVSIISVKLDGVEIEGYEVHGRYVTITEEYSGTKVCRVDYRASPTLNMFAGDGSSGLVAQLSANLVWLARGGFRINVNEGPSASGWRGSMSLVQDTQHQGGLALGVRANGSSYVTLEASGTGSAGSLVLDSDRSLTLHYLDKFSFVDGDVTTEQALIALQQPYAMFTGSSGTATSIANGWRITWFNTVYSHSPNWSDYFSFSNGVITAKRNIQLEISGCMNWTDSVAGNRGFGVFYNSSTVGSGTEYSEFQMFPNTVNARKSVWMTGLVLNLDAGVSCAVGRYENNGAVYVNGTNFSRILLKVLGTY